MNQLFKTIFIYLFLKMLWEFKRKFSKDEKFEQTVKTRFCVEDLKKVNSVCYHFLTVCMWMLL